MDHSCRKIKHRKAARQSYMYENTKKILKLHNIKQICATKRIRRCIKGIQSKWYISWSGSGKKGFIEIDVLT